MCVIAVWVHGEQLLCPVCGLPREMQGRQIALLDQGRVIGSEPRRQRQSKQSIPVFCIFRKPGMGPTFRLLQGSVELIADLRIGRESLAGCKRTVVFIELGFQHAQALKLGKQQSRGIGHRSEGVVRVLVLPGEEHLMGIAEIQIVQKIEPAI